MFIEEDIYTVWSVLRETRNNEMSRDSNNEEPYYF